MFESYSSLDRRTFIRRAAIAATGIAASNAFTGSAGASEKISLALDWYPNANHAGFFQAQTDGLFDQAGLTVDIYTPSDPTVVLQTVGAGKDTFGISYQTDLLLARAQGVPVVSIAALVQHPLICLMSLKTAGITRPADLKAKTVGYPGIPSQEAYLATMLETDGASMADIELVNVDFNLLPALISGQTDAVMGAYWTHETILAEHEGYPVDILRVEQWGVPDFYELVLVTSEDTISRRPEIVSLFMAAVQTGFESTIADPKAALETLMTAYPETDRAVEGKGLELLIPAWMDGVTNFGEQSSERWSSYAGWMASRNLIPSTLDARAAFTTDFLAKGAATPVSE